MSDPQDLACPSAAPEPSPAASRRDVLAYSGAGLAGLVLGPRIRAAQAGDVFPIPAEKGLDPAWLAALAQRGEPFRARGEELRRIGMPVGGIGCGQLYLGGNGRLWLWDLCPGIAPKLRAPGTGEHYARPLEPGDALLAFHLEVRRRQGVVVKSFGTSGFDEVEFRGTYPIGTVRYLSREPALEVELEAFSPFVPTELEDSSLPTTLLGYRLRNTGSERLSVSLRGSLASPVLRTSDYASGEFEHASRSVRTDKIGMLVHGVERPPVEEPRPAILFEDFERTDHGDWTVEGTAFGAGPLGAPGARFAGSRPGQPGAEAAAGDAHLGTLTSREFVIERTWIHAHVAGGVHPGGTVLELLIDGELTGELMGDGGRRLSPMALYVGDLEGRTARLRIADRIEVPGGHVNIDSIVFSDLPGGEPLETRLDHGSIALGLLGAGWDTEIVLSGSEDPERDTSLPPRGSVVFRTELEPGAESLAVFVLAWHFQNLEPARLGQAPDGERERRHYAERFTDAAAVASYVAENHARLARGTRAWRDTWYDSSLPHWLLERTFASASTLATATLARLAGGRLQLSGGAGCVETHVGREGQVLARLFPALEREQRERVDLGLGFDPDTGRIDARGQLPRALALDGQAAAILGLWREHQCAPDAQFLARVYPRAKKALECLLACDPDSDGILDGEQRDARGATWHGAVPRLSTLYLAAVRAGERMAEESGDAAFAARCGALREAGAKNLVARLFDGEAFVQRPDPAHPDAPGTGAGRASDQLLGAAWAHALGLGPLLPERETRAALAALWKYAFAPDVGPYREYMKTRLAGGRWLAQPGEAGLVTCTWPAGGHEVAAGRGDAERVDVGVFNECLTGIEHQVAAHCLWAGLIQEGLVLERAIHDRYHPAKRNPYNEIECDDHAPRAMASYGVFLAACGFELHGPAGHIGFAPRLAPSKFRAAFTAPEGWGSYAQEIDAAKSLTARLELRHGKLRLVTLRIGHAGQAEATAVTAKLGARELACELEKDATSFLVRFTASVELAAGETLVVECRRG